MSYLLRHHPEALSLSMSPEGWVSMDELINSGSYTRQDILDIVANDAKGRYQISEDGLMIRAVSGHSLDDVNPDLKFVDNTLLPDVLYHGTSTEGLNGIESTGKITKMERNYIFLVDSIEEAFTTGKRHGTPCVLIIDIAKMIADGWSFWSPQGDRYVFSKEDIPKEYIKDILWSSDKSKEQD